MKFNITQQALIVAIVLLLALGAYHFWKVDSLEDDVQAWKNKYDKVHASEALCKANKIILKGTIDRQNDEIEKFKLDKVEADERWKNRPSKEDYINGWMNDNNITVKGTDCEKNTYIFDAIKSNGF